MSVTALLLHWCMCFVHVLARGTQSPEARGLNGGHGHDSIVSLQ